MSRGIKRGTENPTTVQLPRADTKICPECKKEFAWFGEQWVYRDRKGEKRRWFCSYKCWRAEDKRKEHKLRGEGYREYGKQA